MTPAEKLSDLLTLRAAHYQLKELIEKYRSGPLAAELIDLVHDLIDKEITSHE